MTISREDILDLDELRVGQYFEFLLPLEEFVHFVGSLLALELLSDLFSYLSFQVFGLFVNITFESLLFYAVPDY